MCRNNFGAPRAKILISQLFSLSYCTEKEMDFNISYTQSRPLVAANLLYVDTPRTIFSHIYLNFCWYFAWNFLWHLMPKLNAHALIFFKFNANSKVSTIMRMYAS